MMPAIRIAGVTKRYGALNALAGIDLEVNQGAFFGLLGPNGAGKTTLISALSGLIRVDCGTIEVMGHDVVKAYRYSRRALGVVPQELVFDPFFNVREILRIQSGYFGIRNNDDWIDEILAHLDLTSKADANMRTLSGGMKRRVLVAQALVHRPPVIVLDEPTAGVDVELRQELWQFICKLNQDGHTIILTTHYLEEAEMLCERIAMLKSGQIVALDTTHNLLSRFSSRVIRIEVAEPQRAVLLGAVQSNGNWVEFPYEQYGEVEKILARLREADIAIRDMRIEKPDLERVFIEVMKGGI